MKQVISLLLALVLCLSLCACGGGNDTPETTQTTEPPAPLAIELCAEYAISELESVLKNPNSLIINDLYGVEAEESYIFAINYSAENSFGGMNTDNLFLEVALIDNGFSVKTYGVGSFVDEDNQKYTAQFCGKYKSRNGYYVFDAETIRVSYFIESEVTAETVEFTGKLKGKNDSYEGAWNVQIGDDSYLKVVYFAEGTDLSWYEQFTGSPYEVTISAVLEEGKYYDAVIVDDPILNASDDERFQRFNYHDRVFFKEYVQTLTPMTEDEIRAVLTDNTFKMRNNYGGDGDGTHSITFYADGSLDADYLGSDGQQYTMFESWTLKGGTVVLAHSFTNTYGEQKTSEYVLTPYQYDANRYLLIHNDGDYSMILTIGG